MSNAPTHYTDIMTQIKSAGDFQPEAIENVIERLLSQAEMGQWLIGDVINLVGGESDHIERLAKMVGVQVATLESYARISAIWESDIRWDLLADYEWIKYSHLKALAPIVNDTEFGFTVAIDAIKHASANLMTVKELRRYIAVTIRGNEPKTKWVKVFECDGYKTNKDGSYPQIELSVLAEPLERWKTYRIKFYEIEEQS
jgi:hypothetical protein